jgi:hypothetical protein
LLVDFARAEKLLEVIPDPLLESVRQNYVVEGRTLNGVKQFLVLFPVAILKNQNLSTNLR